MRILQITKKFPWPVKDGEVVAIFNLTKGFSQLGHQVTVLALNTNKHYFDLKKLPKEAAQYAEFKAVDINTDIKPLKAFANLFTTKSYNVERFYSPQFEKAIADTLTAGAYDVVILENIYAMRYIDVIRKHTKAKVVLRPHNVEYVIWERLYQNETNLLRKFYLGLLARRLKCFELQNLNKADILLPLSDVDLQWFRQNGCTLPAKTFLIGYDYEKLPEINPQTEENAVAFIGSMDWMPNYEGIDWFLNEVWGKVKQLHPQAKFYLAGRNFPAEMEHLSIPGVWVMGEVDDAKAYMLSKAISIAPLLAGSGTRVKIIESMALGRAVIATTIGAEGIEYNQGNNIIIADYAASFAEAIVDVLTKPNLRLHLGQNAQQLVLDKYDNRKICADIINYINHPD